MYQIFSQLSSISNTKLKIGIVLLSILIAAQVQYIQHGWINPDSVLYLEAAKLFALGEWKAGFDIFPWPFYSLWIAATHTFTTLSIHHSAQLLNVIFFALATSAFIKIIELAGGKQTEVIAGGLIFLSSQYMIGGVLEMLMRDEGFWAFFLTAIVCFIKYYRDTQSKDAFGWQLAIMFAMLFRIEAIVYLALLPLIFIFDKRKPLSQKIKSILMAYSLQILLTIIAISAFITHNNLSPTMLGRLNEVFNSHLYQDFISQLMKRSEIMSTQVLGNYLNEFAIQGLILTFVFVIIAKIISTTGLANTILAYLALRKAPPLLEIHTNRILKTIAVIAILSMALIITKVFVLSGRYVLALSFILMVFAAFYLGALIINFKQMSRTRKWLLGLLLLYFILCLIKNLLPKQEGYNFQQTAVSWMQSHTINDNNPLIFYDDPRLRYYAHASFEGTWADNWDHAKASIEQATIEQYDYLLINHTSRHPAREAYITEKLPGFVEIKRFYSAKKNKFIVIYQNQSHD